MNTETNYLLKKNNHLNNITDLVHVIIPPNTEDCLLLVIIISVYPIIWGFPKM